MSDNRGSVVGGVILIMLGLAFLGMQVFESVQGALVPLGLGVAFLAAHFIYRNYGYLVPGGILAGLGVGLLAEEILIIVGEPVVLGLGGGFLLIFVIDRITRTGPSEGYWWPLVPGVILALVGLGSLIPGLTEAIFRYSWPVAIIALGVFVVIRGARKPGT